MLAQTVIILTSGLAKKCSPDALDRAIGELLAMKKNPVLVLGKDGDEILSSCQRLEDCEIVFDPNDNGEFAGVKAGLHTTNAAAFVWRLDRPFPSRELFHKFESVLLSEAPQKNDGFFFKTDATGLILTTLAGTRRLRNRASESAWPIAEDVVLVNLDSDAKRPETAQQA